MVRTVYHVKPNQQYMVLKADVMPSQRLNDEPHTPWVGLHISSAVVSCCHCTCMAGLGESCSHIAALLFKVEADVRAGYNKTLCTEVACQWNDDFVRKDQQCPCQKYIFIKKKQLTNSKIQKELKTASKVLTYHQQTLKRNIFWLGYAV